MTNTAIFPQTVTNCISISNRKTGFTFLSASWKKGSRGEFATALHALRPVPSQDFGKSVDSFRMLAYNVNAGFSSDSTTYQA